MAGSALSKSSTEQFDLDEMLRALVEGRGDWVYSVTRPFADAGLAKAQLMMGILHQTGLGVEQDGAAAMRFYRKAKRTAGLDEPGYAFIARARWRRRGQSLSTTLLL